MSLPRHARAVVIGGGIVGCSTAYHLGKLGWKDVVLLERKKLTSGTTFHAAGLVGQLRSSANITRLLTHSVELYERLGSSPDVTVATILGEGSFHQIHGGDTTNQIDPAERRARVYGYSQQYAELRGRAFRGPGKPIHYVGSITSPAAR